MRSEALSVQPDCLDTIGRIETFLGESGEPIFYVVGIRPFGFVVVSADDEVEPIIAYSKKGEFDASAANPLFALATSDLKGRVSAVRNGNHLKSEKRRSRAGRARKKWDRLARFETDFAEAEESTEGAGESSIAEIAGISGIRVAPLLASEWGQNSVCGSPCFNYYTPENYRAGCVAVTMAQIMRYYEYPQGPVGRAGFWIRTEDSDWYAAYMRGGNGYGGPYYWNEMMLIPDCSITETQRRAIGALLYDAAISVSTVFGPETSQSDTLRAKDALVETFNFAGAVRGYNDGNNIGEGLIEMLNPNLDAGHPVIIGIKGESGHAVVCDGYGYNSSTFYHHLNMGWRGFSDAWYNLPNIDSSSSYDTIHKCIYNITASGLHGEFVSGRLLTAAGAPIENASAFARSLVGSHGVNGNTFENGVYAFDGLYSDTTYTIYVEAEGYKFTPINITTGTSRNDAKVSGNVWGVDLRGRANEALIGWWKLDERWGMSIAEDSAGDNNGVVHGGPAWLPSGGVVGGAIHLNGERYVQILNESNFDLVHGITAGAWVKIDDVDKDWQTIIAKGDSAWRLSTLRNERRFYFAVTGGPDYAAVEGSVSVGTGEWHHVCGTYDGANIRLYVDGAPDPSGPVSYGGTIGLNDFEVYIGDNPESPGRQWVGAVDEVRIYNYALAPGAVQSLLCSEPAAGDVNHDCVVDMADYAVFTAAFQSTVGDERWNADCDISLPADGDIDMLDLNAFMSSWLIGDR